MVNNLGYKHAIDWLLLNDDNDWLGDSKPSLSVGASLIAAIYKKERGQIISDLIAAERKITTFTTIRLS